MAMHRHQHQRLRPTLPYPKSPAPLQQQPADRNNTVCETCGANSPPPPSVGWHQSVIGQPPAPGYGPASGDSLPPPRPALCPPVVWSSVVRPRSSRVTAAMQVHVLRSSGRLPRLDCPLTRRLRPILMIGLVLCMVARWRPPSLARCRCRERRSLSSVQ